MAAYWPGLSGAAVAPRWAVMVGASALLLCGPAIRFTTAHLIGILLLAWCAITATWTQYPLDAVGALGQIIILAGVFALGSQLKDLRPLFAGAAIGLSISSAVAIAQYFGWKGLPPIASPSGLFYNKNYLAEAAALVLVYLVASRMWWMAVIVLPAVILPYGRNAWLAAGIALLCWLWPRSRTSALTFVVALALLGAYAMATNTTSSVPERIAMWRDTAAHLTVFGHGIGSFVESFPAIAKHFVIATNRPSHPHNEFLMMAFEAGYVGLGLMLALFAMLLRGPLSPERLVLIALLTEACFAFPFHAPATAFIGLLVAGSLAADRRSVRDETAGSRISLHARLFGNARSQARAIAS